MTLLAPARRVRAITDIDVLGLKAQGVRCVLFDRDNTVVPRDTGRAPAEVVAWLDEARGHGISLCMVSNNFHTREVEASAAELGCKVVHHAMKPAPFAVRRALALMGEVPERAVLVGDQVFTDVIAGNLAGVRTILVDPQSTSDLWYTHVFRLFERAIGARRASGAAEKDVQDTAEKNTADAAAEKDAAGDGRRAAEKDVAGTAEKGAAGAAVPDEGRPGVDRRDGGES